MKTAPVKLELEEEEEEEDELEDEHGPLYKRSKIYSAFPHHNDLGNNDNNSFPVPPSQYNPLNEPSPLGLRLRKSPSLLDLIQMRLSQPNNSNPGVAQPKKEHESAAVASASNSNNDNKLKASNFPASVLKIGTWEYKSRYEGDLVAKCYFAKHKLVWEVLDGGLKNKIEIQWSDIIGLKATYPDDELGNLDLALVRQPLFFRETNPQPRKHTLWQTTTDFTGGQASINRQHYLQCPPGLLGKHFEKLIQCDPRLNFLSQQPKISSESPYFETRNSVFDELDDVKNEFDLNSATGPAIFDLRDEVSTSGARSSFSRNEHDFVGSHLHHFSHETPSPSSVIDSSVIENIRNNGTELKNLSCWDHIRVPGLHPSMSMNDFVSHLENQILEPSISNSSILSSEQRQSLEILEEISRCLFTDSRHTITSDEKSVMSRVNSLCCLLQKDPSTVQDFSRDGGNDFNMAMEDNKDIHELKWSETELKSKVAKNPPTPNGESNDGLGCKQEPGMSRKDSVGDLLLNLPRIASLPQFCFNFSEDFDNQSR